MDSRNHVEMSRHRGAQAAACVLVATLCSACLVVPTKGKITASRRVGTRVSTSYGPVGALTISGEVRDRRVVVEARRQRTCTKREVDVLEVTKERSAKVVGLDGGGNWGGGGDEAAAIVLAVLIPVAVISTVVTAVDLAVDGSSTQRSDGAVRTSHSPCPVPAGRLRVEVALPSGAVLAGVTNTSGSVAFALPDGEPASGTVIARVGSERPRALHYGEVGAPLSLREVRDGLRPVRDAIDACAGGGGEFSAKLTIDIEAGMATLRPPSRMDVGLVDCVDAALARASFRRNAARRRVSGRFHFGSALRRTCAKPLARWRAAGDRAARTRAYELLPSACQRVVARAATSTGMAVPRLLRGATAAQQRACLDVVSAWQHAKSPIRKTEQFEAMPEQCQRLVTRSDG